MYGGLAKQWGEVFRVGDDEAGYKYTLPWALFYLLQIECEMLHTALCYVYVGSLWFKN